MCALNVLSLRVEESELIDVGKIRVRLDLEAMNALDVKSGDIIQIIGKKTTGAIALRSKLEDKGKSLIRMDGIIRSNCGVGLGDIVKIKKTRIKPAMGVSIAMLGRDPNIPLDSEITESIKNSLTGRPVKKDDIIKSAIPFSKSERKFVVCRTEPNGIVKFHEKTELILLPKIPDNIQTDRVPDVTYEDIGGLEGEILRIREMIELPLRYPELFERLGIESPSGVLLQGPPGCGKTLLAKAVANESNVYFLSINGPEIMSKFYGESEKRIRQIFDDAERNAPAIIFIDEIDSIAPKRENVTGEVERRVVAQLLALMDGLKYRNNVIVIGASNRPNAIDPALRRPGRFDREIEIGVPDKNGREEVLLIHSRGMPLEGVDLTEFATRTHGFVGADLAALCREAAMFALRRIKPKINFAESRIPFELIQQLGVKKEDFEEALRIIDPSALREIFIDIPSVPWESVGGLKEVKRELIESVELPIKNPNLFKKFGIKPTNGVLLFGCPGTGKTLIAKAVATESETNFIAVRGPEIFSKWVGESEKAIREIFRKARQTAPSIIFFDEIDALAPERGLNPGHKVVDTVVNQLLSEISGLQNLEQVVCIAATNRPEILDKALLRPGRFDKLIYVPMPDEQARITIFKIHTKDMPISSDINLEKLAKLTEGYSGADIENICREAVLLLIREDPDAEIVSMKHFEEALSKIKTSVSERALKNMKEFAKELTCQEIPE
ncbi:MAG: CDC48 family AAA ATPase [Candidatus Hodarchaeota archaeon]